MWSGAHSYEWRGLGQLRTGGEALQQAHKTAGAGPAITCLAPEQCRGGEGEQRWLHRSSPPQLVTQLLCENLVGFVTNRCAEVFNALRTCQYGLHSRPHNAIVIRP